MKKVLIYGDSNVWGDNFLTNIRLNDDKQWVNIVKKDNKDKFIILQEGLPGRVAGNVEKEKKYKNGKDTFLAIFKTCAPIDIIIIALGTNDLQIKYHRSAKRIIKDLLWYQDTIKQEWEDDDNKTKYFVNKKLPEIIYLLPPNFDYINEASMIFDNSSEEKRNKIIDYFQKEQINCITISNVDLVDGIHFSPQGHLKVAEIVKDKLNNYEK